MVEYEDIPIEQAKSMRREVRKSPIIQEYENLVLNLEKGKARVIDAAKNKEKPQTIKNRIIRIAKTHNLQDLKVQRRKDTITFWFEKEPEQRLREPAPSSLSE